VGRYWVPRYLLVPGTAATLAYCTNPDDRWGWFLEQLVKWKLAGEIEVLGENLPQRHFVRHKIPHDRPGLGPRTAAVGSQRLTAKAMARPFFLVPFRRLLRLAGSRWRYSTPPPHGFTERVSLAAHQHRLSVPLQNNCIMCKAPDSWQAGVAVTLDISVWEMFGSILDRDKG
jgi:hypothetical protein